MIAVRRARGVVARGGSEEWGERSGARGGGKGLNEQGWELWGGGMGIFRNVIVVVDAPFDHTGILCVE